MADCVWCQNADINAEPPCEWVKENLNKSEADFTSTFPCAGTKEMYESGNWGNASQEPLAPEDGFDQP